MPLNSDEYQHIVDLMRGKEEPDPVLTGMKDLFRKEWDCELYDCIADRLSDGQGRLRYVVWDRSIQESFMTRSESFYGCDAAKEAVIKKEFSRLCRQESILNSFHDPENYFALPAAIAEKLAEDIAHRAEKQVRQYLGTITPVCRYEFFSDTVHIFYRLDADIAGHQKDGLSEAIENRILAIKKAYDEFGVLTDAGVTFSSLQTLREKYDNNMFYYFR